MPISSKLPLKKKKINTVHILLLFLLLSQIKIVGVFNIPSKLRLISFRCYIPQWHDTFTTMIEESAATGVWQIHKECMTPWDCRTECKRTNTEIYKLIYKIKKTILKASRMDCEHKGNKSFRRKNPICDCSRSNQMP